MAHRPDGPEALGVEDKGLNLGASSGASVILTNRMESSGLPNQVYPGDGADGITTSEFRMSP
jgi:hypothetical protein